MLEFHQVTSFSQCPSFLIINSRLQYIDQHEAAGFGHEDRFTTDLTFIETGLQLFGKVRNCEFRLEQLVKNGSAPTLVHSKPVIEQYIKSLIEQKVHLPDPNAEGIVNFNGEPKLKDLLSTFGSLGDATPLHASGMPTPVPNPGPSSSNPGPSGPNSACTGSNPGPSGPNSAYTGSNPGPSGSNSAYIGSKPGRGASNAGRDGSNLGHGDRVSCLNSVSRSLETKYSTCQGGQR